MRRLDPAAPLPAAAALGAFLSALGRSERLVVLTGAGCSTESGIPDYRSPNGSHSRGHKPMTYQEFVRSPANRRRYWSRAFLGWPLFARAKPGPIHRALADLGKAGRIGHIVTQNVDGLHSAAGSPARAVTELHGNAHRVVCLTCGDRSDREAFQRRVAEANPEWAAVRVNSWAALRPDADAETQRDPSEFVVPGCAHCGGALKPDVVMFGESIPQPVVQEGYTQVEASDAILAIGTSLEVPSVFRYVRHSQARGVPLLIANVGPTRADPLAHLLLSIRCGDLAALLADAWGAAARPPDATFSPGP